jgi:hypothetical protein
VSRHCRSTAKKASVVPSSTAESRSCAASASARAALSAASRRSRSAARRRSVTSRSSQRSRASPADGRGAERATEQLTVTGARPRGAGQLPVVGAPLVGTCDSRSQNARRASGATNTASGLPRSRPGATPSSSAAAWFASRITPSRVVTR